jgi:hypothetical protein
MNWWGWTIAGAVLLGAELTFVNAQFYLVFVGSAAIFVGLITAAMPVAVWAQWALFALLAVVSMVTFRRRVYDRFHGALPQVSTGPAGGSSPYRSRSPLERAARPSTAAPSGPCATTATRRSHPEAARASPVCVT